MKHVFSTPYEFEGEIYAEIDIDLDSLKGSDLRKIRSQMMGEKKAVFVAAIDDEVCIRLAAKASKKPLEFFDDMPVAEYCEISQTVQNFLLNKGLIEATQ